MLNFLFCLFRSLQKMAIIVKSTLILRERKMFNSPLSFKVKI